MGKATLASHLRQFYVARNMALSVASPNPASHTLAVAARHFGGLRAGVRAPLLPGPPVPVAGPQIHFVPHADSQVSLRLCFAGPPLRHPHAIALQVLRRVWDDGSTSRLQSQLVDGQGLAYELWADADLAEDFGAFDLGAAVSPHKVGRVVQALLDQVVSVHHEPPSPAELRRAVDRLSWGVLSLRDAAPSTSEWYGRNALLQGGLTPEDVVAMARKVDGAACLRAVREWLTPWRLVVVGVGDAPRAQKAQVRRAVSAFATQVYGPNS
jgi:predicted Zn-dependent peptidase